MQPQNIYKNVPDWFLKNSSLIRISCGLIHLAAIGIQIAASVEWIQSEFMPLGAMYFSATAMGVDAMIVGVREDKKHGISVHNLSPGGWVLFGMMLWLIALPFYQFGARRRTIKNAQNLGTYNSVDIADWALCGMSLLFGAIVFIH